MRTRPYIVGFCCSPSAYKRLAGLVEEFVSEPTTMPWGNRALLFRDPDGNLVNFFTPVTPAAVEKFAR